MPLKVPKSLQPLLDLVIHVVCGALAFTVIFFAAAAIALLVKQTEAAGVSPPWLTRSAYTAEKVIWGFDLLAVGLFIVAEIAKFVRRLWQDGSKSDA